LTAYRHYIDHYWAHDQNKHVRFADCKTQQLQIKGGRGQSHDPCDMMCQSVMTQSYIKTTYRQNCFTVWYSLVRCVIFAISVAKIDFIGFGAQIRQKYWGSIFPASRPHFMSPFSKWQAPSWICHILTVLSYTQSQTLCLNLFFWLWEMSWYMLN